LLKVEIISLREGWLFIAQYHAISSGGDVYAFGKNIFDHGRIFAPFEKWISDSYRKKISPGFRNVERR